MMVWLYLLLFSTVIVSGMAIFILNPENRQGLKLLLAFSAAFLIGITFLNLVPEVFEDPSPFMGLFILVGFLLQLLLELLTRGAEHGH